MLYIDHLVICAAFNNAKCGWHLDTTLGFFLIFIVWDDHITILCDIYCPPQASLNSKAFGDLSLKKALKCNHLSNASLASYWKGKLWDALCGSKLVPIPPPPSLNSFSLLSLNSMSYVSGLTKGNPYVFENVFICVNCHYPSKGKQNKTKQTSLEDTHLQYKSYWYLKMFYANKWNVMTKKGLQYFKGKLIFCSKQGQSFPVSTRT